MTCEFAGLQEIGDRDEQQDAFGFAGPLGRGSPGPGGALGAVADGVGGLQHGALAARTAVSAFLAAYRPGGPVAARAPEALHAAAHSAHEAVLAAAGQAGAAGRTAATLAVAAVIGPELHWISAGDSRVYLVRDGRLHQITRDHTYGAQLDDQAFDQGAVSLAGGDEEDKREVVTSCLGMPGVLAVDASRTSVRLLPGDIVMVCSDGLYKTLPEQRIAQLATSPLDVACRRLLDAVLAEHAEGQDNATVLLMAPHADRADQLAAPAQSASLAPPSRGTPLQPAGITNWFSRKPR